MPDRIPVVQVLQLVALLSAVPLQYWLTSDNSESIRQYEMNKFVSSMRNFGAQYLNVSRWVWWCEAMIGSFSLGDDGESVVTTPDSTPPKEVMSGHENGHFASSIEPRTIRTPDIKYRIGQVIKHQKHGYYGVVVGWDEKAKAPTAWLDKMHPADRPDYREQPNYAVVIDTRDRLTPQLAYVVQENMELVIGKRVMHPLIEHYFEDYDGAQYLARPWLKKVYPQD